MRVCVSATTTTLATIVTTSAATTIPVTEMASAAALGIVNVKRTFSGHTVKNFAMMPRHAIAMGLAMKMRSVSAMITITKWTVQCSVLLTLLALAMARATPILVIAYVKTSTTEVTVPCSVTTTRVVLGMGIAPVLDLVPAMSTTLETTARCSVLLQARARATARDRKSVV